MTLQQQNAFYLASGFHAPNLSFDVRLFVGGMALVVALLILSGLMHLLDSPLAWDKMIFMLSILSLSFVLMLLFIYVA